MADEADRLAKTKPLDLGPEIGAFLSVAGKRQRDRLALAAKPRHGVHQQVGSLDVPEFPDIDEVGGVVGPDDRVELRCGHTIEDATDEAGRRADHALIGIARERALEQEQVGAVHQRAFEAAIEGALEGVERIVQRAAVRRVDADGRPGMRLQANEGTGLGAVAVQDLRLQPADQPPEPRPCHRVGGRGLAPNGEAMNPKLETGRDLRQRRLGALATGQAVGDDADMVAAIHLSVGEVEDVAEDSADRRAHRVQIRSGGSEFCCMIRASGRP